MSHVKINGMIILSGCLIVNDKKELLLLYRKDHKFYETPGGKVELKECLNPNEPSLEELSNTAERELKEELGTNFKYEPLIYFASVQFKIPDGRIAIANKFLSKIIGGEPILNEPHLFEKFDYLPINKLENYPLSPDLKLLTYKIKKYFY